MQTLKTAGFTGAIICLISIGLILVEWFFFLLIIPLFLYMAISLISFNNEELKIEVTRNISKEKVFEKDKVEVTLEIKNKGEHINFLELFDKISEKISISSGSNYCILDLKKNEKIIIKYEINCDVRGHYKIGPLYLRSRDFFGLFYREKIIDNSSGLVVIPHIENIRNIYVKEKAKLYPGSVVARRAGIGTEFYGIRKYVTGDTFKQINWKSFAKFNDIVVNEYALESTTDVVIIIDSRDTERMGSLVINPLEYSVKAAVSIASFYLKRRDRVGMLSYGKSDGDLTWVYPDSGKNQLFKITEKIVEIQANGEFNFTNAVNRAVIHMIPKNSLVILISSLENDETIGEGIAKLSKLGFKTMVISPSLVDIENLIQKNKEDKYDDIAYRILSLQRKNLVSELRGTGTILIDWNPEKPLSVSLEEVQKYQTRR